MEIPFPIARAWQQGPYPQHFTIDAASPNFHEFRRFSCSITVGCQRQRNQAELKTQLNQQAEAGWPSMAENWAFVCT